ncbi:MAG: hypothetical protein K8S54_05315 [Spirochaetia bacterium]|nr:hypothetical protein [Spirochaetia bacterium]
MKRKLFTRLAIGSLILFLGSGCLVSNLSNGFDLKSPSGFLGYLGSFTQGQPLPPCNFDEGLFDTCSYSP